MKFTNIAQKYYSVNDVAKILQLSPKTIRTMITRGDIDGYRVGLRVWRIADSALVTYLESRHKGEIDNDRDHS